MPKFNRHTINFLLPSIPEDGSINNNSNIKLENIQYIQPIEFKTLYKMPLNNIVNLKTSIDDIVDSQWYNIDLQQFHVSIINFTISNIDKSNIVLPTNIESHGINYSISRFDSPRSSMDSKRSNIDSPRLSIDYKRSSIDSPRSSIDYKRSNIDSPRSSMDSKCSSIDSPRSRIDSPRSSMDSKRSNIDSPRLSIDYKRSSIDSPRLSIDYKRSSIDSPRSSMDSKRTNINSNKSFCYLFIQIIVNFCGNFLNIKKIDP